MAGLQFGLGFAKLFFWGKGFGKTSADFPPAERGLGNECGRDCASGFFGGGYSSNSLAILLANAKNSGACFISCALGLEKGTS